MGDRARAIWEARLRGETVEELGERFGLRRERIEQICIKERARDLANEAAAASFEVGDAICPRCSLPIKTPHHDNVGDGLEMLCLRPAVPDSSCAGSALVDAVLGVTGAGPSEDEWVQIRALAAGQKGGVDG